MKKQPDAEVPMASITKVMTLLLTLEAVEAGKVSMTDIVPITEHAYNMGGSQIWLEPGEQFTLDELIKAICVCSGQRRRRGRGGICGRLRAGVRRNDEPARRPSWA